MGRSGRSRAALVVGTGVLIAATVTSGLGLTAEPAIAAPPPKKPAPAPPLDPAWFADRPRFEPLDSTPLTVNGLGDYRGAIEVTGTGGGVSTINDVSVEDYVRGIAEVSPSWPAEALKAQAIAARSYALNQAASTVSTPFRTAGANICATDSCQVYAGITKERQEGGSAWAGAVTATAGQVVLYNGTPIFAEYSDSNGGRKNRGGSPRLCRGGRGNIGRRQGGRYRRGDLCRCRRRPRPCH